MAPTLRLARGACRVSSSLACRPHPLSEAFSKRQYSAGYPRISVLFVCPLMQTFVNVLNDGTQRCIPIAQSPVTTEPPPDPSHIPLQLGSANIPPARGGGKTRADCVRMRERRLGALGGAEVVDQAALGLEELARVSIKHYVVGLFCDARRYDTTRQDTPRVARAPAILAQSAEERDRHGLLSQPRILPHCS